MEYHDKEWGVPVHDERMHFEFLILEGAQAGLSWITILKRRENYKKAYDNFEPEIVATYGKEKIEELMNDEGIIRNRRKIESSIKNAKSFIEIQKEFGSFDTYIWSFTNQETICVGYDEMKDMPSKTELSEKVSKDLKKRGFSFVGPTIIYAHLQAIGIVNDHIKSCFRYKELKEK
jgi:DNA-3-methyladenine glycosylase I